MSEYQDLVQFRPARERRGDPCASVQFVRKLSGFTKPSKANEVVFDRAVDDVAGVARQLIDSLVTAAPARDRDEVTARARARAALRFG